MVCVALLVLLLRQVEAGALYGPFLRAGANWPWLLSGIVMTFLGLAAGAVRWGKILAVQGIHFPAAKILHIFFIGQFFNAFMLGACGGDVARAYYAAKGQEGRRAEATMTVFMDRAIGLFSTLVFCCLMIVLRIPVFLDNEGPRSTGVLMVIFLGCAVVGICALFRKNVFEHFSFFQRLEDNTKVGPLIRRAYEAFFLYRRHTRMLLLSFVLSILNVIFQTLACYSFGQALEVEVPMMDYLALFPIITVLMAVPITPGSLGVRESLFVTMFRAVMVDRPHAILMSLMVYAGGVFWSLAGGLMYLLWKPSLLQPVNERGQAAGHEDSIGKPDKIAHVNALETQVAEQEDRGIDN